MKNFLPFFLIANLVLISLSSCIKLKHDMTIQPVHVTVEIRLKIDKELEDFFGDIDQASDKSKVNKSKETEE